MSLQRHAAAGNDTQDKIIHASMTIDKVYHDATIISKCKCVATTFYGINKSLIYQFENRHVSMLFAKNKQPKKQIKLLKISTQDANANRKLKVFRRWIN